MRKSETEDKKKDKNESSKANQNPKELSVEDQFEMQQWLNQKKAIVSCQQEIDKILEKYNAILIVDPNSLVRIMAIKVVLRN